MSVLRLNRAVAVEEDDIPFGSYRYRQIEISISNLNLTD